MATPKPSEKPTIIKVEKRDTLSQIALDYLGAASKYKQLAAINNISNPDLIYVGQTIKLTSDGGSSSSTTTANSNKPAIDHFGELSNADNTLFATWSWSKSNTESYKVYWTYDTGDGVWFVGENSTITVDKDIPSASRQDTYNIPSNAKRVRFKVKPISKTYKKGDKEVNYWDADWSDVKTWTDSTPLVTPGVPDVTIEKYKLTAELDNITIDATGIEFEIVKNNAAKSYKTGKSKIVTGHASFSCTVDAGGEYKVRCRAYKGSNYSDWSAYSGNESTIPAAPAGITTIRAASKTSVYLEWSAAAAAKTYDIEYSTKKEYFDTSDETTTRNGIEYTKFEVTGLESGHEYFFRVRAVNTEGESGWSEIKSVVIGTDPAAPTTWSSTTTAITGEELVLYWVHNAEDGSSQTFAELELIIDGVTETRDIENDRPEEDKDKMSSYPIYTKPYAEGTKIQWRVRTAGVTKVYGDWSVQRTIDIYAPATLELDITDSEKNSIRTLTEFPFYISGLPGPNTQAPIGYHVVITANEIYETTDNVGNPKTVNNGEQVYSKYFDTTEALLLEMSAGNIDLENNIEYTLTCTVSMNSGLTTESSVIFNVQWSDEKYEPSADISIDEDTMTAYIQPFCENVLLTRYKVTKSGNTYSLTTETVGAIYGEPVVGAELSTGEQVYLGVTDADEEIYYATIEERTAVPDILLSVYRREFDGSFTEIATGLDNARNTTVVDPHPALDFARYRIVATTKSTGAVSFYDPPGYPVGGKAVIIQWDEEWTNFETSEEAALEQPPWSGSLLRLPYNIDVSDTHQNDVELVEYIGREHPVSYYGTQLGHTATWNVAVEKSDEETLYALRRLARWMGDAYVREPSGSGYWANITVGFSQKHRDLIVPVTLSLTRVEGGI